MFDQPRIMTFDYEVGQLIGVEEIDKIALELLRSLTDKRTDPKVRHVS